MKDEKKNDRRNNLKELNHSDYKIAESQPDIKNWKILDLTGKKVGKVKDLLFDTEALKVRYIVTNLKKGDFLDEDREVLIPIGHAQLDRENDRVVVPDVTRDKLSALPHYRKVDDLTHEDETRTRNTFAGTSATYDRNEFYDHEHFDEERFYNANDKDYNRNTNTAGKVDVVEENLEVGKREVETGGARISSRIVERPVEERVNLREEHVNVNRNRVDRPADSADLGNYEERTIEEHETAEVPVINKEARVVEEVSLDKEVRNREEVIRETVRETEVDVDHLEGDGRSSMDKSEYRNRDTSNNSRDVNERDPRNSAKDIAEKDRVDNRDRIREEDRRNRE